jgi:hypothetical protein
MLTGAPGALVKKTKKRKICIENNTFYTFEKLITQVSIKLYHIWFLNHYASALFSIFLKSIFAK